MSYLEECFKKFNSLSVDFKNKIGSLAAFEKIEGLEEKYGIGLKFLVILVAIREISLKNIPEYLQTKYQLAEEDAYEIRDWLLENIFQLTLDSQEEVNIFLESKNKVVEIFHSELVDIIKNQDQNKIGHLGDINEAIFFWLSKDGLFQNELVKVLLANQEVLTSYRLNYNGQEIGPTVSNWLKDFISENGSELFSNIVLVKYLSNNQNVKKLTATDRDLVKKLLKLYRNLVFFPESMNNVPLEDWEVFPIDRPEIYQKTKKVIDVLDEAAPSAKSGVRSGATKSVTVSVPPISAPTSVPIPTPPTVSEIDELQGILNNYAPDSFEYKTISQEINRLKQEKK